MAWFKKDKKAETTNADKELANLTGKQEDNPANATPYKAEWHTSMRTNAYFEKNAIATMMVFWVAFKEDDEKWRVMQYTFVDDKNGGGLQGIVRRKGAAFKEAVADLNTAEFGWSRGTENFTPVDVAKEYPDEKVFNQYYLDVPHYKKAAEIEGFVFDEYNEPVRQIDGKIFEEARIPLANLRSAAEPGLPEEASARLKMEAGVLGDIFATEAGRKAGLDDILQAYETLYKMDEFAEMAGSLYLSLQSIAGVNDKLEKVEGLGVEDKKKIHGKMAANAGDFDTIIDDIIPQMNSILDEAAEMGANVEPFRKHAAECELFAHLQKAALNRSKLEKAFLQASIGDSADAKFVANVRRATEAAAGKFYQLGGTQDKMTKLKAFVADPKNDKAIPEWIPGFVTRYYVQRAKAVEEVKTRQKNLARDVQTLPHEVKPSTPTVPVPPKGNSFGAAPAAG